MKHTLALLLTLGLSAGAGAADIQLRFIGQQSIPTGTLHDGVEFGGISGLEIEYNDTLQGQPGKLYYEQDVWGKPIAGGTRQLDEAKQGTDLYLTLDQSLQYEAEHSLGEQVTATGAKSGQAVIMRPSTGEILAMASVADDGEGNVENTRDNRSVTSVSIAVDNHASSHHAPVGVSAPTKPSCSALRAICPR